jgi:disulfide bond formation protein DsbB
MSAESINIINTIFSLGVIGFQVIALFLIIGLIFKDRGPLFAWIAKKTLILLFFISFAGIAGSLIYQYVVGFAPCVLCWYQRIVMYPIAIVSLVALIKKYTKEIFDYSLILSIIGAVISIYHNFEKILGKDLLSCDATGPSCLQILVKKFGFIDIPVMALTFFVLIILLIINKRRLDR